MILDRNGPTAQSTDKNQKTMSTPEDWTPFSLSYWISSVANSCEKQAQNTWTQPCPTAPLIHARAGSRTVKAGPVTPPHGVVTKLPLSKGGTE